MNIKTGAFLDKGLNKSRLILYYGCCLWIYGMSKWIIATLTTNRNVLKMRYKLCFALIRKLILKKPFTRWDAIVGNARYVAMGVYRIVICVLFSICCIFLSQEGWNTLCSLCL